MVAESKQSAPMHFQVGTATLNLQQLLRQGRDFSELLIEVPIMDQQPPPLDALLGQSTLAGKQGGGNDVPTVLSKGSIVLRIINIGREPRNLAAGG
jgi:nephrocystin-4